jgi:hypothetical protein
MDRARTGTREPSNGEATLCPRQKVCSQRVSRPRSYLGGVVDEVARDRNWATSNN